MSVTVEDGKVIMEMTFDSIEQMRSVMISIADRFEFVRVDVDQLKLWMSAGDAEFSAEEQIKALWNEQEKVCDYANGIREGIKQTLRIHGIHYDWLEGDTK